MLLHKVTYSSLIVSCGGSGSSRPRPIISQENCSSIPLSRFCDMAKEGLDPEAPETAPTREAKSSIPLPKFPPASAEGLGTGTCPGLVCLPFSGPVFWFSWVLRSDSTWPRTILAVALWAISRESEYTHVTGIPAASRSLASDHSSGAPHRTHTHGPIFYRSRTKGAGYHI